MSGPGDYRRALAGVAASPQQGLCVDPDLVTSLSAASIQGDGGKLSQLNAGFCEKNVQSQTWMSLGEGGDCCPRDSPGSLCFALATHHKHRACLPVRPLVTRGGGQFCPCGGELQARKTFVL